MIFWIEDTAPVDSKAIDSNEKTVDGDLAESIDNCQLATMMTPGQMN